jgi:hypothetical protein
MRSAATEFAGFTLVGLARFAGIEIAAGAIVANAGATHAKGWLGVITAR